MHMRKCMTCAVDVCLLRPCVSFYTTTNSAESPKLSERLVHRLQMAVHRSRAVQIRLIKIWLKEPELWHEVHLLRRSPQPHLAFLQIKRA